MASTCAGVRYSDPIKAANAVADKLKNEEKCDVVICLSHLGWDEAGLNDMEMMAKTRNIDLVLGGHSHSYFKTLNMCATSTARTFLTTRTASTAYLWAR